MAITYKAISTTEVGSNVSVVTLTLPSTYSDLILKISSRDSYSGGDVFNPIYFKPNGATTNGTYEQLYGLGTSASAGSGTTMWAGYSVASNGTTNAFSSNEIYIFDYNSTTLAKPWFSGNYVATSAKASAINGYFASSWNSTSAITSIDVLLNVGSFTQYTTLTLYGIKRA